MIEKLSDNEKIESAEPNYLTEDLLHIEKLE